ncbi:unnamed protein product [Prorocentrum cordatum]|uniref:Protein xylosyltransferase n=1 Tax=Prorocentrum cordatum TaxID=2364126 RepID=A0ABN9U622_9DINO|nr:unnamed protein product [Polarella glacialis]
MAQAQPATAQGWHTPPARAGPAAPAGSSAGAGPPAALTAPRWPPEARPALAARPAAAHGQTPASARSPTAAPAPAHGSTSGPPTTASTAGARVTSVVHAKSTSLKPEEACPSFQIGKNYPGNDVKVDGNDFTGRIDDAVGCSALCFEHGAGYFTYGTGIGYIGLCWCKSKLENASDNSGLTSGTACKDGVEAPREANGAPTTTSAREAEATTPEEEASTAPAHETTTTAEEASCPSCAPKSRPIPAIVIPTYERDLCKANFTALSIAKHDPDHLLGDLYLLWVSSSPAADYEKEIDQLKVAISKTRKVHFHDFSATLDGQRGWVAQQVLKLKVATLVEEDFYVVLDSKNTFVRDIKPEIFVSSCNQAIVFGDYKAAELPELHSQWYETSARLLDVPSPLDGHDDGDRWPPSITPMTFHRQTVLDLLAHIGTLFCLVNL